MRDSNELFLYNFEVLIPFLRFLLSLTLAGSMAAQTAVQSEAKPIPPAAGAPDAAKTAQKPEVKYNYLNVCTPSDAEKQEIKSALARVPLSATYNADFEISHGHTSLEHAESARYLRLRREFSGNSEFSNAQYSLSTDPTNTTETLVLKTKDSKDVFMLSLEDQVSSTAAPVVSLLQADTPVSRIRVERFGKPSIVLARCEAADQSAYEPLFQQASQILARYRKSMGLRSTFRNDLAWLATAPSKSAGKTPGKRLAPQAAKPIERKPN